MCDWELVALHDPRTLVTCHRVLAVVARVALIDETRQCAGELVNGFVGRDATEHLTAVRSLAVGAVLDYPASGVAGASRKVLRASTNWSSFRHTASIRVGRDIITTQSHGGDRAACSGVVNRTPSGACEPNLL